MRTREEQIADLENQFGEEGVFAFVDDRDAATKHIIEAEQRGYERARAECAADTRRLDWLGKMLKLNAPYQPAAINGKYTAHTIRAAIDASMEGGK